MDPSTTEGKIRELEGVRKQINLWRGGTAGVILLTLVICLWTLYRDAKALAEQGPTQQAFVENLQAGLNQEVLPRLKDVASRQLTEMQPVVQKEFLALNTRVPEITQKSLDQITELQKNLPDKASKTLDASFDKAFKDKESEIKSMFPDATEDQVKTLFTNLSAMTQTRSQAVTQELLAPHMQQMSLIQKNLDAISGTEGARPGETGDDWELGLAVFDVVRDDLKDLTPPKSQAAKMIKDAAGHVADTARKVADTADEVGKKAEQEGKK